MYPYRPAHLPLGTVPCVLSCTPVYGIDPIPHSQAASSKVQTDVSGFEVRGVTLFSEAKVVAVLKDCIGRSLTTSGIHTTANRLMLHYRNGGY